MELPVAGVHAAEGVAVVGALEAAALPPPRLRRQVRVDLPGVAPPPLDLKVPAVLIRTFKDGQKGICPRLRDPISLLSNVKP